LEGEEMMELRNPLESSWPCQIEPVWTPGRWLGRGASPGAESLGRRPANGPSESASDRRECGLLDGGSPRELYALRPGEKGTSLKAAPVPSVSNECLPARQGARQGRETERGQDPRL